MDQSVDGFRLPTDAEMSHPYGVDEEGMEPEAIQHLRDAQVRHLQSLAAELARRNVSGVEPRYLTPLDESVIGYEFFDPSLLLPGKALIHTEINGELVYVVRQEAASIRLARKRGESDADFIERIASHWRTIRKQDVS